MGSTSEDGLSCTTCRSLCPISRSEVKSYVSCLSQHSPEEFLLIIFFYFTHTRPTDFEVTRIKVKVNSQIQEFLLITTPHIHLHTNLGVSRSKVKIKGYSQLDLFESDLTPVIFFQSVSNFIHIQTMDRGRTLLILGSEGQR